MAYGGLDIGTTSVKFAIYATGGSLLSLAQSTYGNRRQENPNQISGAAVWAAVKRVLAEANAKCPKDDPLRAFADFLLWRSGSTRGPGWKRSGGGLSLYCS